VGFHSTGARALRGSHKGDRAALSARNGQRRSQIPSTKAGWPAGDLRRQVPNSAICHNLSYRTLCWCRPGGRWAVVGRLAIARTACRGPPWQCPAGAHARPYGSDTVGVSCARASWGQPRDVRAARGARPAPGVRRASCRDAPSAPRRFALAGASARWPGRRPVRRKALPSGLRRRGTELPPPGRCRHQGRPAPERVPARRRPFAETHRTVRPCRSAAGSRMRGWIVRLGASTSRAAPTSRAMFEPGVAGLAPSLPDPNSLAYWI